jgi:hypothetical protein
MRWRCLAGEEAQLFTVVEEGWQESVARHCGERAPYRFGADRATFDKPVRVALQPLRKVGGVSADGHWVILSAGQTVMIGLTGGLPTRSRPAGSRRSIGRLRARIPSSTGHQTRSLPDRMRAEVPAWAAACRTASGNTDRRASRSARRQPPAGEGHPMGAAHSPGTAQDGLGQGVRWHVLPLRHVVHLPCPGGDHSDPTAPSVARR